MAQWSRMHTVLVEELNSVPSTRVGQLTTLAPWHHLHSDEHIQIIKNNMRVCVCLSICIYVHEVHVRAKGWEEVLGFPELEL